LLTIVADNLQITHSVVAKAVQERDPEPIQALVKACEAAGAEAIDINSGPLYRDPEAGMSFLVQSVQTVTDLPLMIDTANPRAMKAGLAACRQPAIINGISLEPAKLEHILPLARAYGTEVIGYLLTAEGHVPPDADQRLAAAVALHAKCKQAGIEETRLIIDPIVAPLSWQDGKRHCRELIDVIRQLPDLLGFPVKTVVGLSNLTTGRGDPEKRLWMQRVYLAMLAASGLSMVLFNVLCPGTVRTVRACRQLLDEKPFSWEMV
jgi:5-methyltetrahydrofolate corrinoid/iron sulfur protein methyltransferase